MPAKAHQRGNCLRRGCSTALLAALLISAGCANTPRILPTPPPTTQAAFETGAKAAQVQQALTVFVDSFIPALAEGCDYVEAHARTHEARAAARDRKIGGALSAMKNAVNPRPYAGLLDMVVMVTLLSDAVDKPLSKDLYGPYGQRLTSILTSQKKVIWALAAQYVTEVQLQELRESIHSWQNAHPEARYVAFVRINEFPETGQIQDKNAPRRPNSVFGLLFLDPLSNLDPAVREFELARQLAERSFFYLQRMPIVVSWQLDALYAQMLQAPEVQATTASVATVAGSTTRFTDATDRFAGTIEKFRGDIPQLRHDALEQVEQGVERQSDIAIRHAATQISRERDAALRQLSAAVRTEQQELTANLQQALNNGIDRAYSRSIALLFIAVIAMLIYRVIARKLPLSGSEAKRSEKANVELVQVPGRVPAQVEVPAGSPGDFQARNAAGHLHPGAQEHPAESR